MQAWQDGADLAYYHGLHLRPGGGLGASGAGEAGRATEPRGGPGDAGAPPAVHAELAGILPCAGEILLTDGSLTPEGVVGSCVARKSGRLLNPEKDLPAI